MLRVKAIENSIQDLYNVDWYGMFMNSSEFCCSWRLNKAAAPDIARMSPQDLTHLFPLTFFGCSDEVLANTARKEKWRKWKKRWGALSPGFSLLEQLDSIIWLQLQFCHDRWPQISFKNGSNHRPINLRCHYRSPLMSPVVHLHVIYVYVDLPSGGVQSNWQTTVWMPPIPRCQDLQPPVLQDWNIEYKSMLKVKRQVVVMKWDETRDCETNAHTHNHTQYHFGETPSL